MKISLKLMIILVALGLFAIASVSVTLLILSRSSITGISEQYAHSMASRSVADITGFLDAYYYKVETMAHVMEQYQQIIPTNRRNVFNVMLEGLTQSNPDIFGAWCVWEPDILEGNDQQYLGTKGTSSSGRFSPYYYWDNGKVEVDALEDYNQADYYLLARNSGDPTILNPFEYEVGGKEVLMTSISFPIRVNGRIVGVAGFDLPLSGIQNISQTNKPFTDCVTAVFSNDGTVTAHFDESRIGKNMKDTEADMTGPYLNDFTNSVKTGKSFTFSRHIPALKTDMRIFLIPIFVGATKTPLSYAIAIMHNTIMAPVYVMLEITLAISGVILALIILAALFLSRSISKPIVKVANNLKDISEGEGDLTRTIAVDSKDEIGDLALYFNKTLEKIKNLVSNVKKEASTLSEIGNDLAKNMNDTAAAVNEITSNIQSIKGRIINQSASVSETHATMEQIVTNIDKLNEHVENQAETISKRSAFIQAMVDNIESVNNTLVKNLENVKNLKEASEIGRNGLQEVASDIQEISRESEGLMEINSVMENIASQTNLLSMNAAIEAAHAGEAGKGFAVVADEIRKLAESSGEQSKTIGTVLKKIAESIKKITSSTENVLARFEVIDTGVKTVAEQEEGIRQAMEEQGEGSRQLLQGTSNLTNITEKVRDGSEEMLEGAKEVTQESNNLEKATQEITGGINEMAIGAENVNTAVNHVNGISGKNRDGIDALIREVSRFKVT
jgi:methyl-accepting chemotaxis protein